VPLAAVVICLQSAAADTPRQKQVERNSMQVMPFSMDATMHHFDPTPTGGVQRVMVHNGDRRQIALVRAHLRHEASAFAHGDFSDPQAIHGGLMPGLGAMRAGAGRLHVSYAELSNGAQITYATHDPALISAIHQWFEAQLRDHASHATMKM
jgi:hypothetical protein